MYDIKKLTIDEKISLLSGKTHWSIDDLSGKIKGVLMADGPHGVRIKDENDKKIPSTAMPNLSVVANGWNKDAAYLDGQSIANDCIDFDVDVLLAPGTNIKRTPLCCRNFEYFSEDPYLSGELAAAYIDGVQSKGVGTSLKHFAMNNADFERLYQSSEADERTMREIYFKPFEIAIKKSKPWTVMCSYNAVNGVLSAENKWLLDDVLRNDLGHDGLIVSDWEAVKNSYKSVKASLDLAMPASDRHKAVLKEAYDRGLITEDEIDVCVQRVLDLSEKCLSEKDKRTINFTKKERHENAVKIAQEGIVLLKNDGILPIARGDVMVTGAFTKNPPIGGGGSADAITAYEQENLADLMTNNSADAKFSFNKVFLNNGASIHRGYTFEKAYGKDAVIICVIGPGESEGSDRLSIKLDASQEDFIINVANRNPNVIVCVYSGSAIDMRAWIDKVKAVVYVGYAGEGSNEALASIITGKVSPSGKLAETFPLSIEDSASGLERGDGFVNLYKEGIMVGYRYYDEYEKDVLFPFGHGLSYAQFVYSNLSIEKKGETDYTVSYDITNVSSVDAKEISQVYIRDITSYVKRPKKELKGFSKDLIRAGQTVRVSVDLDYSSFAYYSVPQRKWYVENGAFEVQIGASSRDIKLIGKIEINLPEIEQVSTDYVKSVDEKFSVEEHPILFGL